MKKSRNNPITFGAKRKKQDSKPHSITIERYREILVVFYSPQFSKADSCKWNNKSLSLSTPVRKTIPAASMALYLIADTIHLLRDYHSSKEPPRRGLQN
jgi:hypothetical protein